MKEKTQYKIEQTALYTSPDTLKTLGIAWLVPGAGHWFQGRKKTGAILFCSILAAMALGLYHHGDLFPFNGEGKFRAIGALSQAGSGLFYLVSKFVSERGNPLNLTYDYGTIYFLIAGMLNWLAVVDSFDIAVKRK